MKIEQVFSSCRVVFEYASNADLVTRLFFLVFVLFPLLKICATIIKTYQKTRSINQNYAQKIPVKLDGILRKHTIQKSQFLISKDEEYVAVSIGFFSKKIILSEYLIKKLSYKELEAVVLHEQHHSKFNHSALLFFIELITNTFFFFPLLKDLQEQIESELEKSADTYAISVQKSTKYVKSSLRKVISNELNFGIFPRFSYAVIDQRIDSLNMKKTGFTYQRKRLYSTVLMMLIFVSLFFLNKKYAMAAVMEEKICVAYELRSQQNMSEANASINIKKD